MVLGIDWYGFDGLSGLLCPALGLAGSVFCLIIPCTAVALTAFTSLTGTTARGAALGAVACDIAGRYTLSVLPESLAPASDGLLVSDTVTGAILWPTARSTLLTGGPAL